MEVNRWTSARKFDFGSSCLTVIYGYDQAETQRRLAGQACLGSSTIDIQVHVFASGKRRVKQRKAPAACPILNEPTLYRLALVISAWCKVPLQTAGWFSSGVNAGHQAGRSRNANLTAQPSCSWHRYRNLLQLQYSSFALAAGSALYALEQQAEACSPCLHLARLAI